MNFISFFLNSFYPKHCPYCGEVTISRQDMCVACEKKISNKMLVRNLENKGYSFLCLSSFSYETDVKSAIWRYKFCGRKDYAKSFAISLKKTFLSKFDVNDFDFVTNVPISKQRLKKRGYDQGKVLAREFSKIIGVRYEKFLEKKKDNPAQHTLGIYERQTNVIDVYAINNFDYLNGKKILIIDDIITSGNTIGECASLLKKNNALCVSVLSLASAVLHKRFAMTSK